MQAAQEVNSAVASDVSTLRLPALWVARQGFATDGFAPHVLRRPTHTTWQAPQYPLPRGSLRSRVPQPEPLMAPALQRLIRVAPAGRRAALPGWFARLQSNVLVCRHTTQDLPKQARPFNEGSDAVPHCCQVVSKGGDAEQLQSGRAAAAASICSVSLPGMPQ